MQRKEFCRDFPGVVYSVQVQTQQGVVTSNEDGSNVQSNRAATNIRM